MSYKIDFSFRMPEYDFLPVGTTTWSGSQGPGYLDAMEACAFEIFAAPAAAGSDPVAIARGVYRGDDRDREMPLEVVWFYWSRIDRPALEDLEPRRLVYADGRTWRWNGAWGCAEAEEA